MFEMRVKEMDEVFTLLLKEKERVTERKKKFEALIINKGNELLNYQSELTNIKECMNNMKKEVRKTVEKEVKDIVYRKI